MNSNTVWKLRRLSRMSRAEIGYRVRNVVHAQLQRRGFGLAKPARSQPQGQSGNAWCASLPVGVDASHYVRAADRILSGEYDVFALRGVQIGFPPRWNTDPRTGTTAPLRFGKTLNYRDEALVGDIKYLWEPSRHLELVTLAQAWRLTADTRYAQGCRVLVDSWIEQCPYPKGVHWTSSLEHAVRLTNWAVAWHLLGGDASPLFADQDGQAFRRRWLDSIYCHCHFIGGHFSRFSSANNHLLGEYMGLLIASLTWPCWPECAQWNELARNGFEREALLQNASDGVNREQAIWYHHEVADMMLLCGLFARASGRDFSEEYWQRLQCMLEFIASLMDVGGHVPMLGDSDDAVMVRFDPTRGFNPYRSLLATGAVLFERGDFKAKVGTFDLKSRWLLGDAAAERFDALPAKVASAQRAFNKSGYYLLGSDFDTANEVRIVADAAPLGYLSIAAHGHADALSFTLSAGGQPLLIDPGTYAYHTQRAWRDYFKGTSAHNTVRVDEVDQSVSGGNFMWLQHANAQCRTFESTSADDIWSAEHDGYRRLADPVQVIRQLIFRRRERALSVFDELRCNGAHKVELFWHFAPECAVKLHDRQIEVKRDGVTLLLAAPASLQCELVFGSEQPPLGWYSASFDAKQPCHTLRVFGEVNGNARFETAMKLTLQPAV